jgi:hypothetical protein
MPQNFIGISAESSNNYFILTGPFSMNTKKLFSLLVASAMLSVPGIAVAGNIDLNTGGARTTINADGSIKVQSGKTKVNVGSQKLPSPSHYPPNWKPRNSGIKNDVWFVKPIVIPKTQSTCKSSGNRYQSTQIRPSGSSFTQSQSSMTVCS